MAKKTNTEETPKTDEQVTQTTEEVQTVAAETPAEETPQTENKQPTNEEKREADPIAQIMSLPNTQDKHKEIVAEWIGEAQEAIKRGMTPAKMSK